MNLSRETHGRPAAPIRIIHLGIGNFTRAHQAWYTEHASDAAEWGIAGFTGRTTLTPRESPRDDALDAQGGVYQLDVQYPEGDKVEVISSVSASFRSHDIASWTRLFADPAVVIVTSTITEAGYCRNAAGDLDLTNQAVIDDLELLKSGDLDSAVFTGPAKFVRGLLARRAAGAGAITFVPCDNVPDNGSMAERIIRQAAEIIASQPQALQLRYLQTLNDIGIQNNTTVVFPVPLDLLKPLLTMAERGELERRG